MPIQRVVVPYLSFWSSCVVKSRRPFVIGVTGSAGKTTTVAMIAAVLTQPVARSVVGSVGSTQQNMNCDRGFPQTIKRRSEEHTYEIQSLMRFSYAVFCLKKQKQQQKL